MEKDSCWGSRSLCEINRLLMLAVRDGETDVVRAMLDSYGHIALMLAKLYANPEKVKLPEDHAAKDKSSLNEKLIKAAREGDIEEVKQLLDNGANVDARDFIGRVPLMLASANGHVEMVRLLLEWKADVDAKDEDGDNALARAAWGGHAEIVQLLLARGVDVHVKDKDGDTALDLAADEGHTEVVDLLEQHDKNNFNQSKHNYEKTNTTCYNIFISL
jgi:ankyrin repeat protein